METFKLFATFGIVVLTTFLGPFIIKERGSAPENDGDFTIVNNIIKGAKRNYDNRSVGQVIHDVLTSKPQHVAQIHAVTGKQTTYANIKDCSVRLALWMVKEGIKSGDVISLYSPNRPDLYCIIFATFYIGATYNPLDHNADLKLLRNCIKWTNPKIMFAHRNNVDMLQEAARLEDPKLKIISLDNYNGLKSLKDIMNMQTIEEIREFKVLHTIDPQSIILIAFSSGTTGVPKAVAHSYEKVLRNVATSGADSEIKNKNSIVLLYMHPSWAVHMWFLLDFILSETTEIIHEDFESHQTCKIIEKYRVDVIYLSTYRFSHLCDANANNRYNLDSIKAAVPIGVKLTIKMFNQVNKCMPNALISKRMGMTETGEISRYTSRCSNPHSEGVVRPNVQIKIVDVNSNEKLGSNETGELCIKTPMMMIGYYKEPTATKLLFDDEGWFHTGDIAYYDQNGELVIVDRLKNIIDYRDYDVMPAYIEEVLLAHPDVIDVAVVPVPHHLDYERAMAFVRKDPESQVTEEELIELTSSLAHNRLLEGSIKFVEEMPRTSNGKINKRMLKELAKTFAV